MINLENAEYHSSPWPHVIVRDFIADEEALDALTNCVELPEYLRALGDYKTIRGELTYEQCKTANDIPPVIIETLKQLDESEELKEKMAEWFLDDLMATYDKSEEYFSDFDRYFFAYGGLSPVEEQYAGSELIKDTHIDNGKKIYTGMIYFREEADQDSDSNLVLEEYNGAEKVSEKVIEYGNNIAVFWPNLPNSWHYAQTRSANGICRRHINFVADGQEILHDYVGGEDNRGWKVVNNLAPASESSSEA